VTRIILDNAIRCAQDARRELRALYLTDPDDDALAAATPVPPQYAALSVAQRVTLEHLLNLREAEKAGG
jgi:hypothetical protein